MGMRWERVSWVGGLAVAALLSACAGDPVGPRFDGPVTEVALPCDDRFDVQDDPAHSALSVGYGYVRGLQRIGDESCADPRTGRLRRSERARHAGLRFLRDGGRACEITASEVVGGGMVFRYACKAAGPARRTTR